MRVPSAGAPLAVDSGRPGTRSCRCLISHRAIEAGTVLQGTYEIVRRIAVALEAADAGGIVHRDLKPQNVLIARLRGASGDFVKVVDFGISKVKTAATLTDDSKLLGTPQYMSPEQAQGRADDLDG